MDMKCHSTIIGISHNIIWPYLLLAALFIGCASHPENVRDIDEQPAIFPDYVGVTIPVGIAPLDFAMVDDSVTTIDVEITGEKGGSIHANGEYADFDIDDWHQLVEANKGSKLTVSVCAEKEGQWVKYRDFSIYVSNHALEEWGITYRRIAPGYSLYSDMGIYQRDLSSFDEEALLLNSQSDGACINCHTSNRTNPDQYVFHVRGPHGATVIHRKGEDEILKARNELLGGSMVYPSWHPDGHHCAFSTNKTAQQFHMSDSNRIEVYDTQSDVFVYNTETHRIIQDSLLSKKEWSENVPVFSPDGKWLYYITALGQDYPKDFDKQRYSLCRIAFDAEKGAFGHEVDTLIKASTTGKSVTWPRPSYDGRYIMYTQIDYGYFSVWHVESDLWLLDLQTGETRRMDEVNSDEPESFHNWNVNSRWFLFTSRRDDGLYTRIYFSSMGDDGKATKPFLLPQRNPKRYYARLLDSYNTPEFAARPIDIDARTMGQRIDSDIRINTGE